MGQKHKKPSVKFIAAVAFGTLAAGTLIPNTEADSEIKIIQGSGCMDIFNKKGSISGWNPATGREVTLHTPDFRCSEQEGPKAP
jgi:hypothetical protein